MTSQNDIEKLRKDIEWDMIDETSLSIFDSIVADLNSLKNKKTNRYNRRFRIDLQPMNRKLDTHYSDHLIAYLSSNINIWADWNRLPITITDTKTKRQIMINANEWHKWREIIYEWLKISKEMTGIL